jgi:tripartite-type tricarboxylate transporter receptor subunit TctC
MRVKIWINRCAIIFCCWAAFGWSLNHAHGEGYPARPITLIVPFPAGGGVDVIARIVADRLSAALGQAIIIDNRAGAAGVIGSRMASRASPDGYTLMIAHTGIVAINPTLYANPGYDPLKDFAPIGLISSTPIVLMAHPSFPARTVSDLIALAREQPGKINFGTPPAGTGSYLAAELFNATAGINTEIITFRGTGQLTNDLYSGQIPIAFNVLAPAMGAIQAKQLRLLAVAGSNRTALFPDIPTVMESGLPGFEAVLHYGLVAPAGTPHHIIERLNKELTGVVMQPLVRSRIAADGGDPMPSTPDEYAQDIAHEAAKWGPLIKQLNLKID